LLRHPRDTKAWKKCDSFYPKFVINSRNIILALSIYGFNPFRTLSSNNIIWLMMLYLYNFPLQCCMNPTSFIMSMIIPRPKMPENNINVYLQPIVDELMKL